MADFENSNIYSTWNRDSISHQVTINDAIALGCPMVFRVYILMAQMYVSRFPPKHDIVWCCNLLECSKYQFMKALFELKEKKVIDFSVDDYRVKDIRVGGYGWEQAS